MCRPLQPLADASAVQALGRWYFWYDRYYHFSPDGMVVSRRVGSQAMAMAMAPFLVTKPDQLSTRAVTTYIAMRTALRIMNSLVSIMFIVCPANSPGPVDAYPATGCASLGSRRLGSGIRSLGFSNGLLSQIIYIGLDAIGAAAFFLHGTSRS
jgi:hypothetical protein